MAYWVSYRSRAYLGESIAGRPGLGMHVAYRSRAPLLAAYQIATHVHDVVPSIATNQYCSVKSMVKYTHSNDSIPDVYF